MALANTRPVQLPVHSPHTEFSDIGLNHHSKIKLSPSQVSKGKPKTLSAKPMTESKGKHDESGNSNSSSSMDKTEHEALSMQFDNGIDDDSGSANSPSTSSFGENSRSPSTNPSIISNQDSNQDSKDTKNSKQDDSSIDSSGFATAPTTPAASGAASTSSSNLNSNSNVEKPRKKYNTNPDKQKANKTSKINIAATGISTTIPVTGERPRPDKHASLEDEVLLTIFKILYDYDAAGKGMTVKQICDVLLEKHPETAKLSSKTSNLVSAKLNAYVKRVEKGEKNLTYALSREWADTSPKRMVYVYRGLLTDDYFVHAIAAMKNLEENFEDKTQAVSAGLENSNGSMLENINVATGNGSNVIRKKSTTSVSDLTNAKNSGSISNSKLLKKSSSPGLNGSNISNNSSGNNNGSVSTHTSHSNTNITSTNLFNNNAESHIDLRITPLTIPYNADVLSGQLDASISNNSSVTTMNSAADSERVYESPAVSDYDLDEFDSFDDRDDDDEDEDDEDEDDNIFDGNNRSKSSSKLISFANSVNGINAINRKDKRSNSGSLKYPGKLIKRVKNITAAAAAPRVPKNMSNSPSPSIVMAAAASLRAAALHALSPSESSVTNASTNDSGLGVNNSKGLDNDRTNGNNNNNGKYEGYHQSISARWLQTVREGFLTQDIGTPEDISLAELDSLFR